MADLEIQAKFTADVAQVKAAMKQLDSDVKQSGGIVNDLKSKIKALEAAWKGATNPIDVVRFKNELEKTKQTLASLNAVGKQSDTLFAGLRGSFGSSANALGKLAISYIGVNSVINGFSYAVKKSFDELTEYNKELRGASAAAAKAGISQGEFLSAIEKTTDYGLVDGAIKIRVIKNLLEAGFGLKEATELMRAMIVTSEIFGKTNENLADKLTNGSEAIKLGRARGLAAIGVVVDLKNAQKEESEVLDDLNPKKFTAAELNKIYKETLKQATAGQDQFKESLSDLDKKVERLGLAWDNYWEAEGRAREENILITGTIDGITWALNKAANAMDTFNKKATQGELKNIIAGFRPKIDIAQSTAKIKFPDIPQLPRALTDEEVLKAKYGVPTSEDIKESIERFQAMQDVIENFSNINSEFGIGFDSERIRKEEIAANNLEQVKFDAWLKRHEEMTSKDAEFTDQQIESQRQIQEAQINFASNFTDIIGQGAAHGFKNMEQMFKQTLQRMLAQMISSGLLNLLRTIIAPQTAPTNVLGFLGFASGGYTGSGHKYDAAGVVHKGEVVWSQEDVARFGGVRAVESIRPTAGKVKSPMGHYFGGGEVMPFGQKQTPIVLRPKFSLKIGAREIAYSLEEPGGGYDMLNRERGNPE